MHLPDITDGDIVFADTETNGVDWKTKHIVGYVIGVMADKWPKLRDNVYLPVRHETGPNLDPGRMADWVRSWADKRITLVSHNLKFDLHMYANEGIYFPNAKTICTQVRASLINEHLNSYSLDELAQVYVEGARKETAIYDYLKAKFGLSETGKSTMAHFWRLPANDPMAIKYALADNDTTAALFAVQDGHLKQQELERIADVEAGATHTLFKMERRGVKVDMHALENAERWVEKRLGESRLLLPWEGFNINSRSDLPKAFDAIGITDYPRTAKGNASFKENFLKTNELGRSILTVRKLEKLKGTFIEGAIKEKLHNGRIHCSFNQMFDGEFGTHTGRLSCSDPNMQQVPKRDEQLAPLLRRVFRTDGDDSLWSENDYSQQEYRLFAAYVNSGPILEAYRAGADIHKIVADMVGVPRNPTGKMLNLAMLYWMGADTMSEVMGITKAVAEQYRTMYYARFPEVPAFLRKCANIGKQRGFVKTILGRRQRFPDRDKSYTAANRVIQGSAADLTKLKLTAVNNFLERETGGRHGIMLQVHDSLSWTVPNSDYGKELDVEARKIMQDFTDIPQISERVDMIADSACAFDWGSASFPYKNWSEYDV
jgi:DNA polymerase-1